MWHGYARVKEDREQKAKGEAGEFRFTTDETRIEHGWAGQFLRRLTSAATRRMATGAPQTIRCAFRQQESVRLELKNPYYNHEKSRISDKIFKPPMR